MISPAKSRADSSASSLARFQRRPPSVDSLGRALPAHGFKLLSSKLGYRPKNPVDAASLSAEALEEVEAFLAALDDNEDVQNVFAGLNA